MRMWVVLITGRVPAAAGPAHAEALQAMLQPYKGAVSYAEGRLTAHLRIEAAEAYAALAKARAALGGYLRAGMITSIMVDDPQQSE